MITREMIKTGYETGLVNLIVSPHGDGIACAIGDNWFYFGGATAEEFPSVEEYKNAIPVDDIVSEIFSVLDEDFKDSPEFEDEYLYYESFLRERIPAALIYPHKHMDVDVVAFLKEQMEGNTKHYQGDFDIDKEQIQKAAASNRKEDKALLWLSRPMGTQCASEHDTFIRGSAAFTTWQHFAAEANDAYIAYAVDLTGKENGVIRGNVCELDFKAHAAEVDDWAVAPDYHIWAFEDGAAIHVPFGKGSYPLCARLVSEHGAMVDSVIVPQDEKQLASVLHAQAAYRALAPIAAVEQAHQPNVKYTVYGVNDMGSTWYLSDKNASRCTLWTGGPKEMRAVFDTKAEAQQKVMELDEIYQFGSTRHFIEPVCVQELAPETKHPLNNQIQSAANRAGEAADSVAPKENSR